MRLEDSKLLNRVGEIPGRVERRRELILEEDAPLSGRIEIKDAIREDGQESVHIVYRTHTFPKNATLKDDMAIKTLRNYFGSSSGILYRELRDKKNLCYSLDVDYSASAELGISSFSFSTITSPSHHQIVEETWLECIRNIAENGIPSDVLETAKNAGKMQQVRSKKFLDKRRALMKTNFGVGIEDLVHALEQLTVEDIKKVASQLVNVPYVISIALPK